MVTHRAKTRSNSSKGLEQRFELKSLEDENGLSPSSFIQAIVSFTFFFYSSFFSLPLRVSFSELSFAAKPASNFKQRLRFFIHLQHTRT